MDRLVDAHILLEGEQKHTLRSLAADRGCSLSAVLREATDHYLSTVTGPSPEKVRRIARAAVGCLTRAAEIDPADGRAGWGGGGSWA